MINPEEHILLCKSIVYKMRKKYSILKLYDIEDLFSIAYLEMVKASKKFDESSGYAFSSLATKYITNAFYKVLDREKNVDIMTIRNQNAAKVIVFLDQNVLNGDGKPTPIGELIPDENNEIDKVISNTLLKKCISILSDKEKKIIYLYYYYGMKQSDIGKLFNLTQVQISRIIRKSIANMQKQVM